jgi:5,10-methylene-tetrahydrofolate dehydrogenase/methenyl tetrahydrofolate cyclohydrolase
MTDATIVEAAAEQASATSPILGSIGPITTVCLLRNTLVAAAQRRGVTNGKI